MSRERRFGQIGLMMVAIIWGNGFVASAMALDYFSAYQILASRFLLAFLVLLIFNLKRLKRLRRATILKSILLGVILYLAFLFQTLGLQSTTPARNAFLTATNVVIVPFISLLFLRKRIPSKVLIGSVVCLLGIGFISLNRQFIGFSRGDGLTLICACFFALHIFFTERIVKDEEPWSVTLIQMGSAAVCSLLLLGFNPRYFPILTSRAVLPILYLGLISTLVAYFIQTAAQKQTTSSEAAIILSTEAFFGMLGSILILGESITFQMIIGAILIFLGILIVELKPKSISFQKVKSADDQEKKSNN